MHPTPQPAASDDSINSSNLLFGIRCLSPSVSVLVSVHLCLCLCLRIFLMSHAYTSIPFGSDLRVRDRTHTSYLFLLLHREGTKAYSSGNRGPGKGRRGIAQKRSASGTLHRHLLRCLDLGGQREKPVPKLTNQNRQCFIQSVPLAKLRAVKTKGKLE